MREIKWAVVHHTVSINNGQVSLVVDDPGLEPWFLIDCVSSLKGSRLPDPDCRIWAITKDGDLYYKADYNFVPTGFIGYFLIGSKTHFSSDEQLVIQKAIRQYVNKLGE